MPPTTVVECLSRSDDDRQVFVAFPHGDLVHANGFDAIEAAMGQSVVDDPCHRPVDDTPIRVEDPGDLGPREPLCPACQKIPIGVARPVLAVGPGNTLGDHHTTTAAVDPPHPIEQHDRESPQGNELKRSRLPSGVVDPVPASASRTHGSAASARLHVHADAVAHKAGRAVHEARVAMAAVEDGLEVHSHRGVSSMLDRCDPG